MDWTEERVATLTQMWRDGSSASQVARWLGGVSRNAVIGKLHRLGLSARDVPARPRAIRGSSATERGKRPNISASMAHPTKPQSRPRILRSLSLQLAPTATITSLAMGACRWPIGDPRDECFGYCGRSCAVTGQGSYCQCHAQVAFRRRGGPRSEVASDVAARPGAPLNFAKMGRR